MMASENVDLPKVRGATKPVGLDMRRNSTGKAVSGDKKEKVVPHYLRASTGSCHDFCKYGRKHSHDAEERIPFSRRAVRKSFDGLHTQGTGTDNPSAVKVRMSLGLKPHSPDGFSAKQEGIYIASYDSQNQVKDQVLEKRVTLPSLKVKTPPALDSRLLTTVSGTAKPRSSLGSEKLQTSSQISLLKPKVKLSAKNAKSSTPSSIKASTPQSTESSMVSQETLKPKFTPKPVSTSGSSAVLRKNGESKGENERATSKVAHKKAESYTRASLSPRSPLKRVASFNAKRHRTLKIASHPRNKNYLKKRASEDQNNDEVVEKTLYVVEMENGNKCDPSPSTTYSSSSAQSFSSQEDQEESNLVINGNDDATCLTSNVTGEVEKQETVTDKRRGKLRKDVSEHCEDKDCKSSNSRPTRRKFVDVHACANSPRTLRFRRGRVMNENTSFKPATRRISFKRTRGSAGDVVETASGPEKVVLKHQDVQDKKEVQCLLNNVIEETASKLVISKKSKVKALVGAFESVISLQERKPATSIAD